MYSPKDLIDVQNKTVKLEDITLEEIETLRRGKIKELKRQKRREVSPVFSVGDYIERKEDRKRYCVIKVTKDKEERIFSDGGARWIMSTYSRIVPPYSYVVVIEWSPASLNEFRGRWTVLPIKGQHHYVKYDQTK
jgi:hypothetical protein